MSRSSLERRPHSQSGSDDAPFVKAWVPATLQTSSWWITSQKLGPCWDSFLPRFVVFEGSCVDCSAQLRERGDLRQERPHLCCSPSKYQDACSYLIGDISAWYPWRGFYVLYPVADSRLSVHYRLFVYIFMLICNFLLPDSHLCPKTRFWTWKQTQTCCLCTQNRGSADLTVFESIIWSQWTYTGPPVSVWNNCVGGSGPGSGTANWVLNPVVQLLFSSRFSGFQQDIDEASLWYYDKYLGSLHIKCSTLL